MYSEVLHREISETIWYKSEFGKDPDILSRKEAAEWLSKKILEEAYSNPAWIDDLMEGYNFIVVNEDDRIECPIENGWTVPLALLPHKDRICGNLDDRCLNCDNYDICYHGRRKRG